jgi:hypothetical protein
MADSLLINPQILQTDRIVWCFSAKCLRKLSDDVQQKLQHNGLNHGQKVKKD